MTSGDKDAEERLIEGALVGVFPGTASVHFAVLALEVFWI